MAQATSVLVTNLILYGLLPLWAVTGFIDWCCHRATRIESTSGLKESLIHSLMGVQLGIPIVLCLLFEINVTILLICIAAWLAHEVVAHWDVHYSAPRRHISIWEVHAHNYMATMPLFTLMLISVLNWDIVLLLVSLEWQGHLGLTRLAHPQGGTTYLGLYTAMMLILCVLPYAEENIRCLKVALKSQHNH